MLLTSNHHSLPQLPLVACSTSPTPLAPLRASTLRNHPPAAHTWQTQSHLHQNPLPSFDKSNHRLAYSLSVLSFSSFVCLIQNGSITRLTFMMIPEMDRQTYYLSLSLVCFLSYLQSLLFFAIEERHFHFFVRYPCIFLSVAITLRIFLTQRRSVSPA